MMELLAIALCVCAIHLADKWLDKRGSERFVEKMCGSNRIRD